MKLKLSSICLVLLIFSILITGCGANQSNESDSKQLTIFVAADDESTITYSDDYIQSASGDLYVTNSSEYSVTLLMIRQDKSTISNDSNEEYSVSLNENETKLIEGLEKDIPYEIGCRTSASEGTKIDLIVKE